MHAGEVLTLTQSLRHLEWFHDHVRIENVRFDGTTATPTGGRLRPIDTPGRGLRLRPQAVESCRVR